MTAKIPTNTTPRDEIYEVRTCEDHAADDCTGTQYSVRGVGTRSDCEQAARLFTHAWVARQN